MERWSEITTPYDLHGLESAARVNAMKDEQYALSDLIIVNSVFVKESFIQAGVPRDKMVVIFNGAPKVSKTVKFERSGDRVIFLSAGAQSIRKGSPYLLEAWRRMKSHAFMELWMVGNNTLPSKSMENLPGKVNLASGVSPSALSEIYEKASVLVLPSLCEGFALVILEAMAHGLPIITTANSGCGNFVENGVNGWIIPICDADALAERMAWCLDNREKLSEMGRKSQEKAARWTWQDYEAAHRTKMAEYLA
jgi:glycosyltransferase involved in cell wall biosynthesis